jgi:KDO2-lipid IV(A) lauroyltransferase
MFGQKARISAVAALAVHTGAALMPTATWFDGEDWGARIYDEIPVPDTGTRAEKIAAMSQVLADRFTEAIAEHPQDWHMLQKVFTADLDPARLRGVWGGGQPPHEQGGSGGDRPPGGTL